jgi:NAD(P)-dependent dehydrogenase (short-subunit alcohol dehydrogenase family)
MNCEFDGKGVVITGGAQGIGKCLVHTFAEAGARVYFCDQHYHAGMNLQSVLKEAGFQVKFVHADMGDEQLARGFAAAILEAAESVDVLINNVGVSGFGSHFVNRSFAEWNRMLAVGLSSHFLCSQLFSEALMRVNGCIVNIASTRALMSEGNTEPYSASKGGIVALTHSLAITLGPEGVRVNCISPGWIDVTGWQFPPKQEELSQAAHEQHPVGRVGQPEDIAEACLFLASSKRAGFITGHNLVVDGGMTRKMIYVE